MGTMKYRVWANAYDGEVVFLLVKLSKINYYSFLS